ncbi:MAG: 8-amino-7-oxononanoate synthase [Nitrospinota bacterium]
MDRALREELQSLRARDLYRELRWVEGAQGPTVRWRGREVILLAGNNYLGLADHPRVKEAAARAAREFGTSASASRLISGSMELHRALEEKLARFKGTEEALVFGSGYLANLGLIGALVGPGDAVFSDALNHASIVDGCRLSRAEVRVFPHKDLGALEEALEGARASRRKLIAVDGLFSMDGDLAPLDRLVPLARRQGAWLVVDEAHATGCLGPGGRGAAAHFGVAAEVEVLMGTLGKALGAYGAFVCGSKTLVEYLVNRARSFIFSTALPPPVLAAAIAALEVIEEEPERLAALRGNADYFREGLASLGLNFLGSLSQILPILVGRAPDALAMASELLDAGVFLLAIRPPTVPEGTSRLRASVMATHSRAHLDRALEAIGKAARKVGLGGGALRA